MHIILFGPPGAGKGTQADNLVKDLNIIKISTGDLLRTEIEKGSNLGSEIKEIIDKGQLVPNNIISNLIKLKLKSQNYRKRIIFDGYPRNILQAKDLDDQLLKNKQNISLVISLHVNEKVVIKRILGRQVCSKCGLTFNEFSNLSTKNNHNCDKFFLKKRSDDNEKTIKKRFVVYNQETFPILNYYRKQNLLHEIDGMKEIGSIYKEIRAIIRPIEGWLYIAYSYK